MDDKNLSIVVWLQDLCKDDYDPCSYLEIYEIHIIRLLLNAGNMFHIIESQMIRILEHKKFGIIRKFVYTYNCEKPTPHL